jgi:CRISPR-associated protein Cas2
MLIVSYDIANDKLRGQFAKFLKKFGFRLQFSVYQVKNSKRVLDNITTEINTSFGKKFEQTDSVIIFHLSQQCKKYCFGYAANDDDELIIVD